EKAGTNIVLPSHPNLIKAREMDLNPMRVSLIRNALKFAELHPSDLSQEDIAFLAAEVRRDPEYVADVLKNLG
ncbi:MAG: PLP-dependent lyase/thiolase, partial [Synergistetes bacterium HGW-Synergistetes-2]